MNDQLTLALELLEKAGDLLADVEVRDHEFLTEAWELSETIEEFLLKVNQ